MYARTVGNHDLSFGVSGMLWRDNLVMYDRQTDSWWAQASGTAIRGALKGTTLEILASDMMTWREWRRLHPGTLVLSKRADDGLKGTSDRYAGYHRSGRIGVTGRTTSAGALEPKRRVIGFRIGGRAFAAALDDLAVDGFLAVTAGDQRAIVVATADRTTARVFVTGSRVFVSACLEGDRPMLKDRETGSVWDGYEGLAVSGSAKGQRLERVPAFASYWFSWRSFFPDTALVRR